MFKSPSAPKRVKNLGQRPESLDKPGIHWVFGAQQNNPNLIPSPISGTGRDRTRLLPVSSGFSGEPAVLSVSLSVTYRTFPTLFHEAVSSAGQPTYGRWEAPRCLRLKEPSSPQRVKHADAGPQLTLDSSGIAAPAPRPALQAGRGSPAHVTGAGSARVPQAQGAFVTSACKTR